MRSADNHEELDDMYSDETQRNSAKLQQYTPLYEVYPYENGQPKEEVHGAGTMSDTYRIAALVLVRPRCCLLMQFTSGARSHVDRRKYSFSGGCLHGILTPAHPHLFDLILLCPDIDWPAIGRLIRYQSPAWVLA